MGEHPEALGLKAECVAAGHWRIEGFDVIRYRSEVSERPVWTIWWSGRLLGARETLRDAWITVGHAVSGGGSR
jgi:hypothetical protein